MRDVKGRLGSISVYVIFAISCVLMLLMSWRRWPDIFIDFGRELYVPWQISGGAILYKDIAYLNGPLASYLNAFIFKVFGVSFMALSFFNIFLIFLITVLIYKLIRILADELTALIAGVVFLTSFAFSQYVITGNYNFVSPYSHDLTHGVILSLIALYLFFLFIKSKKMGWIFLLGLLAGMVFLTKIEVFLAIAIALSTGLIAFFFVEGVPLNAVAIFVAAFCCGAVLPPILTAIYFSFHMPICDVLAAFAMPYNAIFKPEVASNLFYRTAMGLDSPRTALFKFALSSLLYATVFATFGALGSIISRVRTGRACSLASVIGIVSILLLPAISEHRSIWLDIGLIAMPLVLILLVAHLIRSLIVYRRSGLRDEMPRTLLFLALTVFSLGLTAKIFFNVHIYHYGFVLAMPGTIILAMICTYQVPIILARAVGDSLFIRYAGLALVAAFVFVHVIKEGQIYSLKTYPVGSRGDQILTYAPEISSKGVVLNAIMVEIRGNVRRDGSLVVLPEGVMVNYMLRMKNPTPYITFVPLEVMVFGEEKMLAALRGRAPDYIVTVDRDTSEYGFHKFGLDYGSAIQYWIAGNYVGQSFISFPRTGDNKFGVMLLRKGRTAIFN